MKSSYMKAAMLHKLRFVQRTPYLASEVGEFNADVASIINGKLSEYEIKVSMADFKIDFRKEKHRYYIGAKSQPYLATNSWIPHYFYFVVPPEMAEECASRLLSYPQYGLIVVYSVPNESLLREAPRIVVRPKQLHGFPIGPQVYQNFLYRMGSELACLSSLKIKSEEI